MYFSIVTGGHVPLKVNVLHEFRMPYNPEQWCNNTTKEQTTKSVEKGITNYQINTIQI